MFNFWGQVNANPAFFKFTGPWPPLLFSELNPFCEFGFLPVNPIGSRQWPNVYLCTLCTTYTMNALIWLPLPIQEAKPTIIDTFDSMNHQQTFPLPSWMMWTGIPLSVKSLTARDDIQLYKVQNTSWTKIYKIAICISCQNGPCSHSISFLINIWYCHHSRNEPDWYDNEGNELWVEWDDEKMNGENDEEKN